MSSSSHDKKEKKKVLSCSKPPPALQVSALCCMYTVALNPPGWIHNYPLPADKEAEVEEEDGLSLLSMLVIESIFRCRLVILQIPHL